MSGRTIYLFPGGKSKTVTFSFDDGVVQDERLAALFNRFGLKGTFNLNSGLDNSRRRLPMTRETLKRVYAGHEIACHTVTHPTLDFMPRAEAIAEVWKDRENLEALTGDFVTGLAYPNGSFSPDVIAILKAAGIEYARAVTPANSTRYIPKDFLEWNPTCHYRNAMEFMPYFLRTDAIAAAQIFYIWGHSYELDDNNEWELIESIASKLAHLDNVWYATNIEICRYIKALRSLIVSTDQHRIYNPTVETIWLRQGDESTEDIVLEPGKTVILK